MKKFKKLSFILGLSSITVLTTACSQLEKIGEDIGNHANQPAETTTTKKLSESDLIRRSLSKMNYLKSWQVESETKTSQEQSNRSLPFDSTSTTLTQFTSDPYVFKSEEISSDGTINASYVKDNVLYRYTKSETSEEWTKGAIPEDRLKDNSYKRSHISNFYRALYIILEVNKDYTFKDNGSTYEFNFKPANADEYRERIFGNNQKVTDFKVEAYSAKYIIDKTTLLPVSVELEQTISYTANSGVKVKLTTSSIDRFKDINQVKDISIKEGYQNAKDEIKF